MSNDKNNKIKSLGGFILVLACLLPTLWFLHDRIDLLQHAELESASIIKCDYKWGTRVSSSTSQRRKTTSYAPIAISEQGNKVRGTLWWASRDICERSLHKQVSVLVHNTEPDKSRINSFFQFWMFPILFVYLTAVVIISLYIPRRGLGQILTMLLLVIIAVSYFRELHPTEDKNAGPGQADKSQVVLNRCVIDRMHDKNLTERIEVKYLLCQKSGITDLSSISDLTNLEELYLQGNQLSSLETIGKFPKLRVISVASNGMLSLKGVEHLPALEELQANLNKINDLSGMQQLSKLKIVGLMKNQIKSITEFEPLLQLEDVVLNYNHVTYNRPLTNKPALKKLQLYSNNVRDITPLYENINMKVVGVRGRGNVSCDQIQVMRSKLAPDASVWGQKGC